MRLYREAEYISRKLKRPEGLAISLINQANLLSAKLSQHEEALPLAEEAYRIALDHDLIGLVSQIESILNAVKSSSKAQETNNQVNVEQKKSLTFTEKGNPICPICKLEGNKGAKICKYCKKPYAF